MTGDHDGESPDLLARLRSLLLSSPAVIYCCRPDAGFEKTFVSENVERLTGFSAGDYLSRRGFWFERIHPDDRQSCFKFLADTLERGRNVIEYRTRHRNGRYAWIRDEALLVRDGHGLPLKLTGSVIDITAPKFAEIHLRASEARYRAIVEDQADMVCRFRPDATLTFANGAYGRFRDRSSSSLLGSSFADNIREDDREALFALLSRLTPGNPVEHFEHRVADASGALRWQAWTHHALFDDKGVLAEYQSVGRDVTERKKTEELMARSNAELQQFAYVASHDLQAPLRNVTGFLQLLEKRYAGRLDGEADEYIRLALDGMDRMRRLISDLLEYSRVRSDLVQFGEVDLRRVVDGAIRTLDGAIGEAGAVVDVGEMSRVRGDEILLGRLFQNLVGNAVKFRSLDRDAIVQIRAIRTGEGVTVSVADNGVGFEPQFAERVFAMFARLHPRSRYDGSGIGLSICRKIAEIHGGQIWAESAPGVGSTFFVTFPSRAPAN